MFGRNRILDEVIRKKADIRNMAFVLNMNYELLVKKITCEVPLTDAEKMDIVAYLLDSKDKWNASEYHKYLYQAN